MLNKVKKKSNGFTLIEIATTMAIIAVIFSVVVSGSNRMNSKSSIGLTAETLTSDLRSTVMSSLNAETFQLKSPYFWGIEINAGTDPSSYTIFADLDNSKTYNTNEKFKTVSLAKNIRINHTTFNGTDYPTATVLFQVVDTAKPYFGETEITSVTGDVSIEIEDIISADKKHILINPWSAISSE